MFSRMPILLGVIIFLVVILGSHISINIAQALFGISLTIKSLIIFLLPFIVFMLLFKAVSHLSNDASKIILFIFTGVILSNFVATSFSQIIGRWIYNQDISINMPEQSKELAATLYFEFPSLIENKYAMFMGIIAGFLSTKLSKDYTERLNKIFSYIVSILMKLIIVLIPVFIIGFILKLQKDGIIIQIIKNYMLIFLTIALAQYSYIILGYLIISKFKFSRAIIYIKNMLAAAISGFSTMSSAASMPLIIVGTEKNSSNKDLVHTVIPATINIHLIGDCIAIPCFAFAILKSYGGVLPDFSVYLLFTIYFVLAKFSVAAVPGGGILVMLPILEQYLGFSPEMLSLITALYILFDPVITSANVLGNGLFAKVVDSTIGKKS